MYIGSVDYENLRDGIKNGSKKESSEKESAGKEEAGKEGRKEEEISGPMFECHNL
jgi:hypothetical protein